MKIDPIRCFTIVITIIILSACASILPAGEVENPNAAFKYGIIWKKERSAEEYYKLAADIALNSGNYVKVNFRLMLGDYYYLIWRSPGGEFVYLNPHLKGVDMEGRAKSGNITTGWLKLDQETGTETIYLLASKERLHELEKLLDEFYTCDEEGKNSATRKISAELARLQTETTADATARALPKRAEKPVESGAVFRGEDIENKTLDYEVFGEGVAFKVVRIIHR